MSDFKFSCPHCEQHLQCDEQLSGREIQCPKCNHLIKIPPVPGHTAEYHPQSGLTWNTFIPGSAEASKDVSAAKPIPKPPGKHSQ